MKKKRISRKFHKLNKERGLVAFCRNLCYSIIAVEKQQGAARKKVVKFPYPRPHTHSLE